MSILEILSRKKAFGNKWIGSVALNKAGLHKARMQMSDIFLSLRRLQCSQRSPHLKDFLKDGIVSIPNFMEKGLFGTLKKEALKQFKEHEGSQPFNFDDARTGFGQKQFFSGGFDRLDGGTINRFIDISPSETPECYKFICQSNLTSLYCGAAGTRAHPEKFSLYQIVHGDEQNAPDIQKVLHRDTFHSSVKIWFFLEDVKIENGPLEYVARSHKMTNRRLKWEHIKSIRASTGRQKLKGGSFRATNADLRFMGLNQPTAFPVKANTLIIADIRGFHRRGQAQTNEQRLCIYGNIRPHPFSPVRY